MLSLIVAKSENGVIGKANDLPWYLPADLRHFREVTSDHTVIMGRKTFESIIARIGKPLPNRKNVVVTGNQNYRAPGATVVHSLSESLQETGEAEVFVIGGASLFKEALPLADRVYLTQVKATVDGDTFFPDLSGEWAVHAREIHEPDDKNLYGYEFITLDRRQP